LIAKAKTTIGKISRPSYAEFQEWESEAIAVLEQPDEHGVTPVWKAFSHREPRPTSNLRSLLEADIAQEDMWWAKAEARVQEQKKKARLVKKARKLASQSLARSEDSSQPRGSQSRQTTLEELYKLLGSQATEDDEHQEIVLDADVELDRLASE
jgi:hypothetical protein